MQVQVLGTTASVYWYSNSPCYTGLITPYLLLNANSEVASSNSGGSVGRGQLLAQVGVGASRDWSKREKGFRAETRRGDWRAPEFRGVDRQEILDLGWGRAGCPLIARTPSHAVSEPTSPAP